MKDVQTKPCSFDVRGTRFQLFDPDGAIAAETTPGQEYEPATTTLLLDLCDPRTVFFDIGAHYGYFAVLIATARPTCVVHAFEPGRRQLSVLRRNIRHNRVDVEVHPVALAAVTTQIPFHDRTLHVEESEATEIVSSVTFADLVPQRLPMPNVVKIDVHGAEREVLAGMKPALDRRAIEKLIIEVHADHLLGGSTHGQLVELLADAGYKLWEVVDFRDRLDLEFKPLTGGALDSLIDASLWTLDQRQRERLLIASAGASIPPGARTCP